MAEGGKPLMPDDLSPQILDQLASPEPSRLSEYLVAYAIDPERTAWFSREVDRLITEAQEREVTAHDAMAVLFCRALATARYLAQDTPGQPPPLERQERALRTAETLTRQLLATGHTAPQILAEGMEIAALLLTASIRWVYEVGREDAE